MNFKRFGVSKNVLPSANAEVKENNGITITCDGEGRYYIKGTATASVSIYFDIESFTIPISVSSGGSGTFSMFNDFYASGTATGFYLYNGSTQVDVWRMTSINRANSTYSAMGGKTINKIRFTFESGFVVDGIVSPMFTNDGQLPSEFEPHMIWHDIPYYIYKTSTDTITNLPSDLYADGTNATVGLVGNMSQTGTPSPDSPIQPSECGDLETEGAKEGQYKIPISSANTTTPVYLGEVESTRKIGQKILKGDENITYNAVGGHSRFNILGLYATGNYQIGYCSHYNYQYANQNYNVYHSSNNSDTNIYIFDDNYTSADDFKAYLAQQYANGTPVTIWYILATPETAVVNEPLRKIGDYADTVSGITIPTITGKDTFDVQTTLKPSEVSLAYTGWHDAEVKEFDGSEWQ